MGFSDLSEVAADYTERTDHMYLHIERDTLLKECRLVLVKVKVITPFLQATRISNTEGHQPPLFLVKPAASVAAVGRLGISATIYVLM